MDRAHLRGPVDIEDSLVIGFVSLNNFDVIQTVMCDPNGLFMFMNVDTGQYNVHPDIAGIPVNTISPLALISVEQSMDSIEIEFEVSEDSIYPVTNSIVTNLAEDVNTEVTIWPNPAGETLNIQFGAHLDQVQLIDLMARQINIPFSQNGQIITADLGHVPSGFYILMLDNKRVSTPIIKQ